MKESSEIDLTHEYLRCICWRAISWDVQDSWAICRIFKKTNTMAQRALSHSWISSLPESSALSDIFNQGSNIIGTTHFIPENIPCTTGARSIIQHQVCNNTDLLNTSSTASFSTLDHNQCIPYKPIANPTVTKASLTPTSLADLSPTLIFPSIDFPLNLSPAVALSAEVAKVTDSIDFGGSQSQQQFGGFPISLAQNIQAEEQLGLRKGQNQQWNSIRSIGFPFYLPSSVSNSGTVSWDSAPCPSELSTTYPSNKCYR